MRVRTHWYGIAVAGSALALLLSCNVVFADSEALKALSAEWWQWALSIPASHNPILDPTGADCMVGQRGDHWFLAGSSGSSVTRTCKIPTGTRLFFPVVNAVQSDSPNQCGQNENSIPLKQLRANAAAFIDTMTTVSATLDGKPIKDVRRVRSGVFSIALPEDNIFAFFGYVPCDPDIYAPAVDDGYYAQLKPLEVGAHTLNFHADNGAGGFALDVTYHLTVVPDPE